MHTPRGIRPKFTSLLCGLLPLFLACGGGGTSTPPNGNGGATNVVSLIVPPPAPRGESLWVACQDGDGPWKVLSGSQTGTYTYTYTFSVTDAGGRYGLALVDVYPTGPMTTGVVGLLRHFTTAEVQRLDYSLGAYTTAFVLCNLAGLNPTDAARLSVNANTRTVPPGSTAYAITAMTGTPDFVATRLTGGGTSDLMVVNRGFPISPTASAGPALNFATGWSLMPQSVTVNNATGAESLSLQVDWLTNSTSARLASGTASPLAFNSVPTDKMVPGEFHALTATALDATDPNLYRNRSSMAYSTAAIGVTLPLPPAFPAPVLGHAATTAYLRPSATWTALPGAMVHDLEFWTIYSDLVWDLHLSKGWLGTTGTPSYTFPNFSGMQGWNDAWGLPFGQDLSWQMGSRQTTYADPGFYIQGTRAFATGNTAWESSVNGGMNVALGSNVIAWKAVAVQATHGKGRIGFKRGLGGIQLPQRATAEAATP